MSNVKRVDAAIEKLESLMAQRTTLHHDLKRSLALQKVWPDAFDHGQCTTQVHGSPYRDLTITIKLGNGEMHTKPLEEVPVILWPEKVKDDIRKIGWKARSKYSNPLKGE